MDSRLDGHSRRDTVTASALRWAGCCALLSWGCTRSPVLATDGGAGSTGSLDAQDAADNPDFGVTVTLGSGASGGADGGVCSSSPITFQLEIAFGSKSDWCGDQPTDGCPYDGLTISDAAGNALVRYDPCNSVHCSTCSQRSCSGICLGPLPLGSLDPTWTWDGTYYGPDGTCGSTANSCVTLQCAPPGHYLARVCAIPCTSSALSVGETCAMARFDIP